MEEQTIETTGIVTVEIPAVRAVIADPHIRADLRQRPDGQSELTIYSTPGRLLLRPDPDKSLMRVMWLGASGDEKRVAPWPNPE